MTLEADPKTLLYVEDEPEGVQLFEKAMRDVDAIFKLDAAPGLEAALMALDRAKKKPMAVLLDLNLGRFKGSDLLRWMRGRPEHFATEVAVFSSLDSERQIIESYDAGADYPVVKPIAFEALLDIVDRINRGFLRPSKNLFLYPLVTVTRIPPAHENFRSLRCPTPA